MNIEDLADDFATKFIIDHTALPVDGSAHRALVQKFIDFAQSAQQGGSSRPVDAAQANEDSGPAA